MPVCHEFEIHWLDSMVEGHAVREWCRPIQDESGKAQCIYCNSVIEFAVSGFKSIRNHASSAKHRKKRKLSQLKQKGPSDQNIKPKEMRNTLDDPYPKVNFNCSVDLLPLDVLYEASRQARSSDFVSLLQRLVSPESRPVFIEVYVCFFCDEEFVSRQALQGHQQECTMKPPELQNIRPLEKPVEHQCGHLAPPSHPPLSCQTWGGGASMRSPTKAERTNDQYSLPSKADYVSALGLLPKKKAAQVCSRRRNTECESIDLDDDVPISPSLPRTPKLLISHLSRDWSENSGENSSPCRARKPLFSVEPSKTEKEMNSRLGDKDGSNQEENKLEEKTRMPRTKSLYNLDLTSPLGQFVMKHIKGDPSLHILSDVESHCLTSTPKKSSPVIQLRDRHATYPVTFRGLFGKFRSSYVHQYKFTRRQKVEFLHRVNTGLDKKSRDIFRKLKPCKVHLTRLTKADLKRWVSSKQEVMVKLKPLSKEEIAYWTSQKDVGSTSSAEFPSGLTFSSPNVNKVLGLKTCHNTASSYSLSVGNYVSEETFAEVTLNRRTVYKSLLSDSSSSESSSPETDKSPSGTSVLRHILSTPNPFTSSQRQPQGRPGTISSQRQVQTRPDIVSSQRQVQTKPDIVSSQRQVQTRPEVSSQRLIQTKPDIVSSQRQVKTKPHKISSQKQVQTKPDIVNSKDQCLTISDISPHKYDQTRTTITIPQRQSLTRSDLFPSQRLTPAISAMVSSHKMDYTEYNTNSHKQAETELDMTSPRRVAQTGSNAPNPQVDMSKYNLYSPLSSFLSPVGKGVDNCTFPSSLHASLNDLKNSLTDSSSVSKTSENITAEPRIGHVRTSIHNVHVRTALEGETITSSVKEFPYVSSNNRESVGRKCKLKRNTAGGSRLPENEFIFKSLYSPNQVIGPDSSRKHYLQNSVDSKLKKRKVDLESAVANVPTKLDSSDSVSSSRNTSSDISWLNLSKSGKQHLPVTGDLARNLKALEDDIQRPPLDSLLNTEHVKKVSESEAGDDCHTVAERRGGDKRKSAGYYRKLAAVGPFRMDGVKRRKKMRISPVATSVDKFVYLKEWQEQMNDSFVSASNSATHFPGTKVVYDSPVRKDASLPSHTNYTQTVFETRKTENGGAPCSSGTSLKIHLSILQTDNSPGSTPAEIRYVTISSPTPPQLQHSPVINTIPGSQRGEVRKSSSSSFLLRPNRQEHRTSIIRETPTKLSIVTKSKSARANFRYSGRGKQGQ